MKELEKDIYVMIVCAVVLGFIINILGTKMLECSVVPVWTFAFYNGVLIVAGMMVMLMVLMAVQLKHGADKFSFTIE